MHFPDTIIIIGAGKTGLSCVRFLENKVHQLILIDEQLSQEKLNIISQQYSNTTFLNSLEQQQLEAADLIILSPGVDPNRDDLLLFKNKIIGDIELFLRFVDKPVVAVTGTNGKSTVVTLVGEVLTRSGMNVGVGGNLGTPAIDLLGNNHDLYVLELSSFQLELVNSLCADIACILNVSPDHLDRHLTVDNYTKIKRKIYKNAQHIVVNRDDPTTVSSIVKKANSFGLSAEFDNSSSGLSTDQKWLMLGEELVVKITDLQILGMHNWNNLLAVIAICSNYKVPLHIMREVLIEFKGLPHRCQVIKKDNDITWINDSKATNVGSTKASVMGFASKKRAIILFLGGQSKGQSFLELRDLLSQYVKLVILFGRDSKLIEEQIRHHNMLLVSDLNDAIEKAAQFADKGDIILFAPGCSSFDMFKNYADRGNKFTEIAQKV